MDMATTERLTDVERYGEEVLNASWLPQEVLRPEQDSTFRANVPVIDATAVADPDSFLRRLYLAQE
ncbi:MAG: hypothetical protein QM803_02760 [Rhodocyclaceae bacterium]